MSRKSGQGLVVLLIIGMFIQLGVLIYVWHQGNVQESQLIDAARAGCKRVKGDRIDQANGYRLAAAESQQEKETVIAQEWAGLASRQERKAKINCIKAYPKESVFP